MDPELKRMLEETRALVKDNHQMLRTIRRHQWYSFIGKIIVWTFVLIVPLYLYQQYLQPLVAKFSPASSTPTSGIFGFPTSAELQILLDSFRGK